jgi:hypothetical protein
MSGATNLVANDTNSDTDVFVYDRVANSIQRISVADNGTQGNGATLTVDCAERAIDKWRPRAIS